MEPTGPRSGVVVVGRALARVRCEHGAHEVVDAARPAWRGVLRRPESGGSRRGCLRRRGVASVRCASSPSRRRRPSAARRRRPPAVRGGGVQVRSRCPKSGETTSISAPMTIWCSLARLGVVALDELVLPLTIRESGSVVLISPGGPAARRTVWGSCSVPTGRRGGLCRAPGSADTPASARVSVSCCSSSAACLATRSDRSRGPALPDRAGYRASAERL